MLPSAKKNGYCERGAGIFLCREAFCPKAYVCMPKEQKVFCIRKRPSRSKEAKGFLRAKRLIRPKEARVDFSSFIYNLSLDKLAIWR